MLDNNEIPKNHSGINITIMNREQIENLSDVHDDTILISITDRNMSDANLKQSFSDKLTDKLFVHFDDVLENEPGCISKKNASDIVSFVLKHKNHNIIVNCNGGVSRSAGVAVAITNIIGQDDMYIWNNSRYSPNMTVIKSIMQEFDNEFDMSEMIEKEKINLDLWRIRNELNDISSETSDDYSL